MNVRFFCALPRVPHSEQKFEDNVAHVQNWKCVTFFTSADDDAVIWLESTAPAALVK